MTRDAALIERLPGFKFQGGRIIHDNEHDRFARVWQVHNYDTRHLTSGELSAITRARTTSAPVFLTPRSGRPGWNVRKTFPTFAPRKRIPFLVVFGGEIVRLAPTGESVQVRDRII